MADPPFSLVMMRAGLATRYSHPNHRLHPSVADPTEEGVAVPYFQRWERGFGLESSIRSPTLSQSQAGHWVAEPGSGGDPLAPVALLLPAGSVLSSGSLKSG